MKTTIITSVVVLASLGCSTATQSPAPGDERTASGATQPAAAADRKFIADPRTGGAVFTGTPTLPSPLKEVGR